MRCGPRELNCIMMKLVVELGWEVTWAGTSSYSFTGMRRNEQLNELLGKVAEVASINESERLEKTKNRGKTMHGNGIQLRQIWSVCSHWVGSSHPCPGSINSQCWAVVQTWLCLFLFPSLQLWKRDGVLGTGRGQWLLGWVPPAGRALWTLLIEGRSEMNWPWPVIQLQAQHGLVHSTNVLWKHIGSSCSMAVPAWALNSETESWGKGRELGWEKTEGKEKKNETTKNCSDLHLSILHLCWLQCWL